MYLLYYILFNRVMKNITLVIFLMSSAFVIFMAYPSTGLSFAQNSTIDNNTASQGNSTGPIAGLSNQAQDVFNGTNQTSGPISQFGDILKDRF